MKCCGVLCAGAAAGLLVLGGCSEGERRGAADRVDATEEGAPDRATRIRTAEAPRVRQETPASRPGARRPEAADAKTTAAADTTSRSVVWGTVKLSGGEPAAGAEVKLTVFGYVMMTPDAAATQVDLGTSASESGEYRIEFDRPTHAMMQVSASAPGYAPATEFAAPQMFGRVQADAPVKAEVNLVLERGVVVEGRVLTVRGLPVEGSTVTLTQPMPRMGVAQTRNTAPQTAMTTAGGAFRFDAVEAGALVAGAEHADFVQGSVALTAPASDVEIVLAEEGGVVEGFVFRKETGLPIAGANVRVAMITGTEDVQSPAPDSTPYSRQTKSDASGVFRFEMLPAGSLALLVNKQGLMPYFDASMQGTGGRIALKEKETTSGLERYLFAGFTLSGTVRDSTTNEPLEGVRVLSRASGTDRKEMVTGADGKYRISGVGLAGGAPGSPLSAALTVEKKGYGVLQGEGTLARAMVMQGEHSVALIPVKADVFEIEHDILLEARLSISGRVLTVAGAPVPDAKVTFVDSDRGWFRSEEGTPVQPDGTYEVPVSAHVKGHVSAEAPTERRGFSEEVVMRDRSTTGVDIVLKDPVAIRVRTETEDGRPLAGVPVTAMAQTTPNSYSSIGGSQKTGENGETLFAQLPGVNVGFNADMDGYAAVQSGIKPAEEFVRSQPVVLKMRDALEITGRLVDGEGKGVRGHVNGRTENYQTNVHAQTEADGSFRLKVAAGTYRLSASGHSGGQYVNHPDSVEAGTKDVVIVMTPRMYKLIAEVVDGVTGDPVRDYEAILEGAPSPIRKTATGFEVEDLTFGRQYTLNVTAPERSPVTRRIAHWDYEGNQTMTEDRITVTLGVPRGVRGRTVYSHNKQPASNVLVTATRDASGGGFPTSVARPDYSARSGEDGTFLLKDVAPGMYRFRAEPETAAARVVSVVVRAEQDLDVGDFFLDALSHVKGRLVSERSEVPVGGVRVYMSVLRNQENPAREVTSGADGTFEIRDLPPGAHSIGFSSRYDRAFSVITAPGETKEITIPLTGPTLMGRLLYRGEPVTGGVMLMQGQRQKGGGSGADGKFEVTDLSPGEWHIHAGSQGENMFRTERRIVLPPMGVHEETIRLDAGEVPVLVTDTEGQPVSGAQVMLTKSASATWNSLFPNLQAAASGSNGSVRFRGLPAGSFPVSASKEGYLQAFATVSVADGRDSEEVKLVLEPTGGGGRLLSLALDDATGLPIEEAWCYLIDPSTGHRFAHSAKRKPDGVMTIEDVPAGNYVTEVSFWGYSIGRNNVQIEAGKTVTVEDILHLCGSLEVHVYRQNGEAIAAVPIVLEPVVKGANSDPRRDGATSAIGMWAARGIRPGEYSVTVSPPGQASVTRRVQIYPREQSFVEVRVE